jgi:ABC-type tungstate transport system substrate-binding protein
LPYSSLSPLQPALSQSPKVAEIAEMSKSTANFLHALAAVVVGNAIYFLVEKHLPVGAYHVPFHIDVGMVVDFFICLVVFGIIKTIAKKGSGSGKL